MGLDPKCAAEWIFPLGSHSRVDLPQPRSWAREWFKMLDESLK